MTGPAGPSSVLLVPCCSVRTAKPAHQLLVQCSSAVPWLQQPLSAMHSYGGSISGAGVRPLLHAGLASVRRAAGGAGGSEPCGQLLGQ